MSKAALALPEINLGIHPGFGGTVRLVQLVGPAIAMDLMLTGKSVRADKALKLGLVDRLVPPSDLQSSARVLALSPPARTRGRLTQQGRQI